MKTTLKIFIYLLAATFMMVSCDEDGIEPLSGKYTPPGDYDLTTLDSQSRVKEESLYIFSINLKDAESNSLNMKFVASDYILPASDFTPSETAVKKTYLTGSEGSTFNGQQIASGTLTVALQDSNYTMNGILYLEDESVIKVTAMFTIAYEPDLYVPTYTYSVEKENPALGGSNGTTEIAGTAKHKITVYADDELYAYLEIVANENALSLSGTYTIKDGVDAAGQVNNGYYLDWSWFGGAGTMEGGSYYVQDEEKMFLREGDGTITIADNAGILTITGENLKILDVETLKGSSGSTWATLETPGSFSVVNATEIAGDEPVAGFTYTNTITAPATYGMSGTAIEGSQLNKIIILDANDVTSAVVELITAEGTTDLSGDYNVVDGTATNMVIGDANNGYYLDLAWYGMEGITAGGCYYVESEEIEYVRAGSVIHVVDNSGVLSIYGSNLAILDLNALVSSNGATWSNLDEAGSFSFSNVTAANN